MSRTRVKRPDLLDDACRPILGFEEAYEELRKERMKYEGSKEA
jgi:hypothetical protein